MKKTLFAFLLPVAALLVCACASQRVALAAPPAAAAAHAAPTMRTASETTSALEQRFRSATALLYGMTEEGNYMMLCTATAFERHGDVYRFVTAAHCVAEDSTSNEHVKVQRTSFFLTFDETHHKTMLQAKIVAVGYQHRGDDFAVLQVTLRHHIPVIPLAKHDPRLGEDVVNFASPLGLGKQLFRGHVSMESLDRPVVSGDINWRGATLLQMSVGPGSSGSSVVSTSQRGIVAFIVGVIGTGGSDSPNIVAIPVSKFKKFWRAARKGHYRWYNASDQNGGDAHSDSATDRDMVKHLWNNIHNGSRALDLEGRTPKNASH